jgi:hypothetical protein
MDGCLLYRGATVCCSEVRAVAVELEYCPGEESSDDDVTSQARVTRLE